MGSSNYALGRRYHTSLRNGSNNLEIEKGRWKMLHKDCRLCAYCDTNQVEDEFHFLLMCSKYHNIRDMFYASINHLSNGKWNFLSRDHNEVFLLLLQGTGDQYEMEIFKMFHKYLQDCFKLRQGTVIVKGEG